MTLPIIVVFSTLPSLTPPSVCITYASNSRVPTLPPYYNQTLFQRKPPDFAFRTSRVARPEVAARVEREQKIEPAPRAYKYRVDRTDRSTHDEMTPKSFVAKKVYAHFRPKSNTYVDSRTRIMNTVQLYGILINAFLFCARAFIIKSRL